MNSKYSSNVANINTQINTDAELVLPLHADVKEFKKDDFFIHDTNHTEVNRVDLGLLPSEATAQYSQLSPYNNIDNTVNSTQSNSTLCWKNRQVKLLTIKRRMRK